MCVGVGVGVGTFTQLCLTLCNIDCSPLRFLCPWDSPGNNTGVGFCSLLQGIFPTQRSNTHLLHWQVDSLPQTHVGSHFIDYTFHPSSQFPLQSFVCAVLAADFKQMGIYVMSNLIARESIIILKQ